MTNSPEPISPDSDSAPDLPAPDLPAPDLPAPDTAAMTGTPSDTDPSALDAGTFRGIREPRAGGLSFGDGGWHQISPAYVRVQLIANGAVLLGVIAAMLVVGLALGQLWAWIVGGLLIVEQIVTMALVPRRARSIGYRLRADDLVFRRGILWQRAVAVPYGRMQLVDITHGPLDRRFGIAQLRLVTAAASTGVVIPGLTQQAAEELRDTLIDVAETRRTGL